MLSYLDFSESSPLSDHEVGARVLKLHNDVNIECRDTTYTVDRAVAKDSKLSTEGILRVNRAQACIDRHCVVFIQVVAIIGAISLVVNRAGYVTFWLVATFVAFIPHIL